MVLHSNGSFSTLAKIWIYYYYYYSSVCNLFQVTLLIQFIEDVKEEEERRWNVREVEEAS